MKKPDLKTAGEQLFGRFWQTQLAKALKVDPSTVRRWASGAVTIPGPAEAAIECMLRERRCREEATATERGESQRNR